MLHKTVNSIFILCWYSRVQKKLPFRIRSTIVERNRFHKYAKTTNIVRNKRTTVASSHYKAILCTTALLHSRSQAFALRVALQPPQVLRISTATMPDSFHCLRDVATAHSQPLSALQELCGCGRPKMDTPLMC